VVPIKNVAGRLLVFLQPLNDLLTLGLSQRTPGPDKTWVLVVKRLVMKQGARVRDRATAAQQCSHNGEQERYPVHLPAFDFDGL